jgi:hypothetical protein
MKHPWFLFILTWCAVIVSNLYFYLFTTVKSNPSYYWATRAFDKHRQFVARRTYLLTYHRFQIRIRSDRIAIAY